MGRRLGLLSQPPPGGDLKPHEVVDDQRSEERAARVRAALPQPLLGLKSAVAKKNVSMSVLSQLDGVAVPHPEGPEAPINHFGV